MKTLRLHALTLMTTGLLAIGTNGAHALDLKSGDPKNGAKLHAKNCTGCHDDGVYKRDNRRVGSKEALINQVSGCEHAANAKLGEKHLTDLVRYLNDSYYKFK